VQGGGTFSAYLRGQLGERKHFVLVAFARPAKQIFPGCAVSQFAQRDMPGCPVIGNISGGCELKIGNKCGGIWIGAACERKRHRATPPGGDPRFRQCDGVREQMNDPDSVIARLFCGCGDDAKMDGPRPELWRLCGK
jgi:hypothetical protein